MKQRWRGTSRQRCKALRTRSHPFRLRQRHCCSILGWPADIMADDVSMALPTTGGGSIHHWWQEMMLKKVSC